MKYVLWFFIYSFIGWIIEICATLRKTGKLINRGFLIGPYCPIYGFGSLMILLFLDQYKEDMIVLFVMSALLCGILEYITSYLMEKMFRARWWDYSDKKFNINGRICLNTLLPFGFLGCLVLRVIHPFIEGILMGVHPKILYTITVVILTLFIIDNIVTFEIMVNIKKEFNNVKKDYTERIRKKVNEMIRGKSKFHQRIIDAFPNYKMFTKRITFRKKRK